MPIIHTIKPGDMEYNRIQKIHQQAGYDTGLEFGSGVWRAILQDDDTYAYHMFTDDNGFVTGEGSLPPDWFPQ